ncbi:MAG: PHP domain-containing protein [Bacteroidia bacterium]
MSNEEIAELLDLYAKLLELHGENSFRLKSYHNAVFKIEKLETELAKLSEKELEQVDGIGKSIAAKIHSLIQHNSFKELEELLEKTPKGVIEMMQIKGIGPKKVATIWHDLGIENVGELLYACYENRLVELKGFGAKTQDLIKKNIEFKLNNSGKFHFATAEKTALAAKEWLLKNGAEQVEITGEIRRCCNIVSQIDALYISEKEINLTHFENPHNIPINLIKSSKENFITQLFETSASKEHLELINYSSQALSNEEEIYQKLNIPFIIPEMREGKEELNWAKKHRHTEIIQLRDLKGIIHVHTNYSDGKNSLREMAEYCKELGYEYLGISDHSQSAYYASGLKPERILEQHKEIEQLNKELAPFKIFKGIESDILSNGELDYEEDILKSFDFVIASIHSNLKMNEEKAMQRLIKAIENPYTTILGHMTGRLLLYREGYPVNHQKIIDACAANNVVIELNAHPYRLDIDWEHIYYAMEKGVMISINPDAHEKAGYHDMYYGICSARKAGLTKKFTFNALSLAEISQKFKK